MESGCLYFLGCLSLALFRIFAVLGVGWRPGAARWAERPGRWGGTIDVGFGRDLDAGCLIGGCLAPLGWYCTAWGRRLSIEIRVWETAADARAYTRADLRESRQRPIGSDTGRCSCVIWLDSSHRFHRLRRLLNHGFTRIDGLSLVDGPEAGSGSPGGAACGRGSASGGIWLDGRAAAW